MFNLAVQLTQQWHQDIWGRVAEVVAAGVPEIPEIVRRRPAQPLQKQNRLQAEQVASLVADYEAGATIASLCQKYGIRHETVRRWLDVNGVELRTPKIGIPKEQIEEAVRLHAEGWGWKRLAKRYGCSTTSVRRTVMKSVDAAE